MYPLLFTTAFLMLMSLFSSSEIGHFQLGQLEQKLYSSYLASQQSYEKERVEQLFVSTQGKGLRVSTSKPKPREEDEIKVKVPKESRARSLRFNKMRPPNNAKLNFYLLLHAPREVGYPETFSIYEGAAQLMRELYGQEPFFQESVRVEYRILDALIAVKEKSREFAYPDELASLALGEEDLQKIFQKMMQGGRNGATYPSLLECITFDKEGTKEDRKINFLSAPEPLLQVLFRNRELVGLLLEERGLLWKEIEKQEKERKYLLQTDAMGRCEVRRRAQLLVESALEKYGKDPNYYQKLLDYTLGKKGTIFYAKDPLTGTLSRQKI